MGPSVVFKPVLGSEQLTLAVVAGGMALNPLKYRRQTGNTPSQTIRANEAVVTFSGGPIRISIDPSVVLTATDNGAEYTEGQTIPPLLGSAIVDARFAGTGQVNVTYFL